jgi:hypothetical protein
MKRILALVTLAACTTGTYRDADAGPSPDAQSDAADEDALPPTRLALPPQPLFAAMTPHAALQVATLPQPQPTAVVKAALDDAAQDLLYTSESDYPFQVLVLPGAGQPHVTAYNVKQKLAPVYVQRPETLPLAQRKVESKTLATLFKPYVQAQDWWGDFEKERAPKFKKLRHILETQLSYLHVYRVGPKTPWGLSPDIDVFIVGTTADNDLIVLWTVSIET